MLLENLWVIELIIAAVVGILALLWWWRRPKTIQAGKTNIFFLLFAFFITAAIASFIGGIFDGWLGTSPTCTVVGTIVVVAAEIRLALGGLAGGTI